MRLLRAATLLTSDADEAARRYEDCFGYSLVDSGAVPAALAQAWGAPTAAGRRFTVLAPESGKPVFLRFVEGTTPAAYRPLRSYGWAAIEICVQDVQAVHTRMQNSPFNVIGPPKALDGAPSIWPMQVQGPDGEIIFLTEIRADQPDALLPRAACPVDCLFILVLACRDIAASRAWFLSQLGLRGGPDIELAYTVLSRAFGLPPSHKHRIAVVTDGPDAFLEIDSYPDLADIRPVADGDLPPGIAIASFAVPSLKALPGYESFAAQYLHDGVLYNGGRSLVLPLPQGGLVELIEAPVGHQF